MANQSKATVSNIRGAAETDDTNQNVNPNDAKTSAAHCRELNAKAIKSDRTSFAVVKDAGIHAVLHAAAHGDVSFINELLDEERGLTMSTQAGFRLFLGRVNTTIAKVRVFVPRQKEIGMNSSNDEKIQVRAGKALIVAAGYDGLSALEWMSKAQSQNAEKAFGKGDFYKAIVAGVRKALNNEAISASEAQQFAKLLPKEHSATVAQIIEAVREAEKLEKQAEKAA